MLLFVLLVMKIIHEREDAAAVAFARMVGLRRFVRCVFSTAQKREAAMRSARLARAYYLCLFACVLNGALLVIAVVAACLGWSEWTLTSCVHIVIPLLALVAAVVWLVCVLRGG